MQGLSQLKYAMETVQRCSSTEKNAWKVSKQLAQNSSEGKSSNLKKGKENEKPFWFEVGLYHLKLIKYYKIKY